MRSDGRWRWQRYGLIVLDEVGYVPLAEIGARVPEDHQPTLSQSQRRFHRHGPIGHPWGRDHIATLQVRYAR
jgi:hypothetical protein